MDVRPSENLTKIQPSKEALKHKASQLNTYFHYGKHVAEAQDIIQAFPKPIAIDFNNVLVNNIKPYQVNPEAKLALDQLREIGNVFIITTKTGWSEIHQTLVENGLWGDDIVLIANENWKDNDNSDYRSLTDNYVTMMKTKGIDFGDQLRGGGEKRIAPIFGREREVPLIDDGMGATHNNPGVLGLQIHGFEPGMGMEGEFSLQEAVDKVREYYSETF